VLQGTADLLAQTEAGVWVFDHKSDAVRDPRGSFFTYSEQLEGYATALEAAGVPVAGVAINWIHRGEVAYLRVSRNALPGDEARSVA
jgi:hypothetical protein